MSSEPGTVPNGSERTGSSERPMGRPARVSDEELDAVVQELASQAGSLPTLDAIIEASGGCQRTRAVESRRRVARNWVHGEASAQLSVPSKLEARHRAMMVEWVRLAEELMRPALEEQLLALEKTAGNAEAAAQDAREALELERQRIQDLTEDAALLREKVALLERRLQRAKASEIRWRSRAEERAAAIEHLTGGSASGGDGD